MFLWKTDHIIEEIKKYIPQTYETLHNIQNINEANLQEYINRNYFKTDSISIDYAVLERSSNVYVIPSEIGWDDIGTWKSVERYKIKDDKDNVLDSDTILIESNSNMIVNNTKK